MKKVVLLLSFFTILLASCEKQGKTGTEQPFGETRGKQGRSNPSAKNKIKVTILKQE